MSQRHNEICIAYLYTSIPPSGTKHRLPVPLAWATPPCGQDHSTEVASPTLCLKRAHIRRSVGQDHGGGTRSHFHKLRIGKNGMKAWPAGIRPGPICKPRWQSSSHATSAQSAR